MKKLNQNTEQIRFFEEQLFEAKRALFSANSVKKVKFLQNKINYLEQKVKKLEEQNVM